MEKCCSICGKYFETDSNKRKNCDDCVRNKNSKKIMMKAISRSRRTYYEPVPEEFECSLCGKKFKTIRKLLFQKDETIFCSQKCYDQNKKNHAKCIECGNPINGSEGEEFYVPDNWHTWFCSNACKEAHDRKIKLSNGWQDKTCAYCGKPIFKKEGIFCNKECYNAAVREGRKPKKKDPVYFEKWKKCRVCGREVLIKEKRQPDLYDTHFFICSKECAKKERETFALERKKQKELEKEQKRQKSIQENGLCSYCKTSYKDCERMQSNFRIIPNGARYNGNNVIAECPKYKG